MDCGFFDLQRLHRLAQTAAFFMIRGRTNLRFRRTYSHAVRNESGVDVRSDIRDQLRRVRYHYEETGKTLTLLSNTFMILVLTIADLYRSRWQIELFSNTNRISGSGRSTAPPRSVAADPTRAASQTPRMRPVDSPRGRPWSIIPPAIGMSTVSI